VSQTDKSDENEVAKENIPSKSLPEATFQPERSAVKSGVLANINENNETLLTSHPLRSWTKDVALLNMEFIRTALEVFQVEIVPLKAVQLLNMLEKESTCAVFQRDRFWLNDFAPSNMDTMLWAFDVSQPERSSLNVADKGFREALNVSSKIVIPDTHQLPIG